MSQIGQVSAFNDARGYGFISAPSVVHEKKRYFVHHKQLVRTCLRCGDTFKSPRSMYRHFRDTGHKYHVPKSRLHTGEYVEFGIDPKSPQKGKAPRAQNVKGVNDGALMCDHVDIQRNQFVHYVNPQVVTPKQKPYWAETKIPTIIPPSAELEKMLYIASKSRQGQVPHDESGFPVPFDQDKDWGSIVEEDVANGLA